MTFGDFVKAKREEASLSQRNFAAQLDISPVYVSYIEAGKRKPPKRELLQKIAEVLHLNKRDTETMMYFALKEKYNQDNPDDIIGYVCSNDYAKSTLRLAKECQITDEDWNFFTNYIYNKYTNS